MILDQEGVDFSTAGALTLAQLRERMDAVDSQTAARANERFQCNGERRCDGAANDCIG
jgi:hypothetical protein